MDAVFLSFIDVEDVKVIAVWMGDAGKDLADDEVGRACEFADGVDFDSGEGELGGDLFRGISLKIDE